MRPVDKGPTTGTYTTYGQAKPDLLDRLGDYCSYCERRIETHLAVEHVQPKSREPALELAWSNFLLGCVHCNSSKGDTPIDLEDFVWPDTDNTLRAFVYEEGGIVKPAPDLSPVLKAKAQALIRLVGLDKYPGNPDRSRRPSSSDLRWLRRLEALEKARRTRDIVENYDAPATRELAVQSFAGYGMFSIWYAVFEGDADMRRRLVEALPGTAANCFDGDFNLVPRSGGKL
ncbi:MAG: HNH endonuclease [Bacteroidota bacterium]